MQLLRRHPRRHRRAQVAPHPRPGLRQPLLGRQRGLLLLLLGPRVNGERAEERGEVGREGDVRGDVGGEAAEEAVGVALEEEGDEVGIEEGLDQWDNLRGASGERSAT